MAYHVPAGHDWFGVLPPGIQIYHTHITQSTYHILYVYNKQDAHPTQQQMTELCRIY